MGLFSICSYRYRAYNCYVVLALVVSNNALLQQQKVKSKFNPYAAGG